MQGPSIAQDKAHMGHSPPRGFVHHQQCRSPAQIHWSRVCKWKRQSFCSKGRRLYEYKVAVSYQKGVYKARTSTPSLTTACRGTPCSASGGDWDAHPWVLTQAAGHKIRQLSGCCRWCGQDVPPWKSHYQSALGHGGAWTHSFIQITWEQKLSLLLTPAATAIALQQTAVCPAVWHGLLECSAHRRTGYLGTDLRSCVFSGGKKWSSLPEEKQQISPVWWLLLPL